MAIVLDFETYAIGERPEGYPPKPVGLAYRHVEPKPRTGYHAWAHKHEDQNSKEFKTDNPRRKAEQLIRESFDGKYGTVIFHNGPFDIEVAMTHFGVKWPKSWGDSMFLAFLNNPRETVLSLKPLSRKYLKRKTSEQDAVQDWLVEHQPVAGIEITKKTAGAFICYAPPALVGKYAVADCEMTGALATKLAHQINARAPRMLSEAYTRELALAPITMSMEQTGVRVDVPRLEKLGDALRRMMVDINEGIVDRLGGEDWLIEELESKNEEFSPGSAAQLGAALQASGKLSQEIVGKSGKQSTSMEVLLGTCTDKPLVQALGLRSVVGKYLNGFITPWLASAARSGGYINPRFNQIRNRTEERGGGTRTGRYSSANPNLQQVPANNEESKNDKILKVLSARLEHYGIANYPGLRDYFLVDVGAMWVSFDYSQQELRILAHFERGQLMREYLKNPDLDVHDWIRDMIRARTGVDYPRKFIKTVVFGLLYGMGKMKLSRALKITEEKAGLLKAQVLDTLPNVKALMRNTKGEITTWGGRLYSVEPPKFIEGELSPDGTTDEGEEISFEYKQLNVKIQGSAADCTKQGMLQMHAACPGARIALTVHDEVCVQVYQMSDIPKLAEAMCDLDFTPRMQTKPKISKTTWARAA